MNCVTLTTVAEVRAYRRRYGIPNAVADNTAALFTDKAGLLFIDDETGKKVAYVPPELARQEREERAAQRRKNIREEAALLARHLLESSETKDTQAWIGVDLDGTLARYTGWKGATQIGKPIPRMVRRVRRWVSHGKKVKIFTARADDERSVNAIKKWLKDNELPDLEITNLKDQHMTTLWDDRAVSVEKNTGKTESADTEQQLIRRAKNIKHCGDYGMLYYHPEKREVHWTAADSDSPPDYTDTREIVKMLKLPGIVHVEIGDEWSPDEDDGWKRLA